MPNYERRHRRVKIRYAMRTAYQTFDGSEHGKILYEMANREEKVMVEVKWDNGQSSPVFWDEIEDEPT